jgi:hypothetical protein
MVNRIKLQLWINRYRVDGNYLHVLCVLADNLQQHIKKKKTSNCKTCLNVETLHEHNTRVFLWLSSNTFSVRNKHCLRCVFCLALNTRNHVTPDTLLKTTLTHRHTQSTCRQSTPDLQMLKCNVYNWLTCPHCCSLLLSQVTFRCASSFSLW